MYMALHITDPEVEKEVRELATQRGQSITDLIGIAVRQLRCRGQQTAKPKPTVDEMLALIQSFPRGPVNYDQIEDEILGYGPNGY
jgi:hypothetical protein